MSDDWSVLASHDNRFSSKLDVPRVSSWPDQDAIAVACRVDRILDQGEVIGDDNGVAGSHVAAPTDQDPKQKTDAVKLNSHDRLPPSSNAT